MKTGRKFFRGASLLVAAAISLAACSGPLQQSELRGQGYADDVNTDIKSAMRYARNTRQAYRGRISNQILLRQGVSFGALAALSSIGYLTAFGGSEKNIFALGATTGAGVAVTQLFTSDRHQFLYAAASLAIGCTMDAASPVVVASAYIDDLEEFIVPKAPEEVVAKAAQNAAVKATQVAIARQGYDAAIAARRNASELAEMADLALNSATAETRSNLETKRDRAVADVQKAKATERARKSEYDSAVARAEVANEELVAAGRDTKGSIAALIDEVERLASITVGSNLVEVAKARGVAAEARSNLARARIAFVQLKTAGAKLRQSVDKIQDQVTRELVASQIDVALFVNSLPGSITKFAPLPPKKTAPAVTGKDSSATRLTPEADKLRAENARLAALVDLIETAFAAVPNDACSFDSSAIGGGLALNPSAAITVAATDAEQTVALSISGGRAPYRFDWQGLQPPQGTGKFETDLETGLGQLTITIPKDATAQNYGFRVGDAAGAEVFSQLIIQGKPAASPDGPNGGNGGNGEACDRNGDTPTLNAQRDIGKLSADNNFASLNIKKVCIDGDLGPATYAEMRKFVMASVGTNGETNHLIPTTGASGADLTKRYKDTDITAKHPNATPTKDQLTQEQKDLMLDLYGCYRDIGIDRPTLCRAAADGL
ncbi:MAG: hypothetical protein ACPGGK_11460 [Pikeienuella sp.]